MKAIPANLPDEIVVDVTPLKIGNKLYVGDIKNDQYTFLHPDNAAGAMVEDDEDEEEVATDAAPEAEAPAAE